MQAHAVLEAPHRLGTWLHISQMLHPHAALLPSFTRRLPFVIKEKANNSVQSPFSVNFLQLFHSQAVCASAAHHTAVRFLDKSQS